MKKKYMKLVGLMMALGLALGVAACGGGSTSSSVPETSSASSSVAESSSTESSVEEQKVGKIRVFDDSFAYLIRNFIKEVLEDEDITTLIVHCAAGVSRSPAVAAAISQYLYGDNGNFFETQVPNKYVYEVLLKYLKGV